MEEDNLHATEVGGVSGGVGAGGARIQAAAQQVAAGDDFVGGHTLAGELVGNERVIIYIVKE